MLDKAVSLAFPISMAIMVLLVTFSITFMQNDWFFAFMAGASMGLASWIKGMIFADPNTMQPLVSVAPRLFVGIAAFAVYRLVLKLLKEENKRKNQVIAITLGTLVGLLVNTVLFLIATSLYSSFLPKGYQSFFALVKGIVFFNILPEYMISIIFTPLVVLGVRHGLKLGIDGNNFKRALKEKS